MILLLGGGGAGDVLPLLGVSQRSD